MKKWRLFFSSFIAGISLACGATLRERAMGVYLLDEAEGQVLLDSSGRGHHGRIVEHGARRISGVSGGALSFATKGHAVIPKHKDFALSEWTVTAYLRLQEGGERWQAIFSNEKTFGHMCFYLGLAGDCPRGGLWQHGKELGGYTSTGIGYGSWNHVAVTGKAGVMRIFVNGKLVLRKTGTLAPPTLAADMILGARFNAKQNFFHGDIDELAVFKGVLRDSDIHDIYTYGLRGALGMEKRVKRFEVVSAEKLHENLVRQRFAEKYKASLPGRNRVYTFIDNHNIDSVNNVEREINEPIRSSANPILVKDKPWEKRPYFTMNTWNVLYDDKARDFFCLYEDMHTLIYHARSVDSLCFTKPRLKLNPDYPDTNIILGGPSYGRPHAGYVFQDPYETDPEKRYKMLYTVWAWKENDKVYGTLNMAWSKDGITWNRYQQPVLIDGRRQELGDTWTITADTARKKYYMFSRHHRMHDYNHGKGKAKSYSPSLKGLGTFYPNDPDMMNKRRVYYLESEDLFHWTEPEEIITPDMTRDGIDWEFYGLNAFPVGDVYLGFLHVFSTVKNTMDVLLVSSRDMKKWDFVTPRRFFLPRVKGQWDQGMVNIPSKPINMGDDTLIYYGGSFVHHDTFWGKVYNLSLRESWDTDFMSRSFGLGLARLKLNRYVAMRAAPREGAIVTIPIVPDGDELIINARTIDNEYEDPFIKVDVLDENDCLLTEFSKRRCDAFRGDEVRHKVSWQGKSKLSVKGKKIRLRFYLKYAELYSFQFQ